MTPPLHATRTSKPPYHHGDLPRALVAAATRLIEDGAGAQVTLRAAAEAAGVSIAAPYRHLESREALLAAVLIEGFRELTQRMEDARAAATEPLAALAATGVAYVRFAADRPALYRLMFSPACDKAAFPELMDAGHASLTLLQHAVRQARPQLAITEDEVAGVALTGWSLTHGLASLYVDGLLAEACPAEALDRLAQAMVAKLIAGLSKQTV
ncbi:MAG: TetR/AcrR family transcriptional regulator [Uliginosibacterium sp.]|nr:TetR/AcrR family transcriptional regulator [Uliginosibacterium sp.]